MMINWTPTYIASQIIIILVYVCLCSTYFSKSRKRILILNIIANVLQAISFLLLGGLTGVAMDIIYIARDVFFIVDENKHGKSDEVTIRDVAILIGFITVIIVLTMFTYNGLTSLLSVVATIISTFAVWQKSTKVYKVLGIPVSIAWLGYHISLKSIFAIILESILFISTIIGYRMESVKSKKTTQKQYYVDK